VKTYKSPRALINEFSKIFTKYVNMKQYTYGFLLKNVLHDGMRKSKVLFTKPVEPSTKVKVVSDNLVFWELLYYFTGASRTRYDVKLDTRYLIRHIPIDALDIRSSVYKHEAGVANVLSHVLVELFGDRYFSTEFNGRNEISYRETTVFRREFQIRNIAGEEDNEFADGDYDFALTLNPLGINKTILIDLTTALWKKGLFNYEDYIKRWRETCFNIPNRHPEIRLLWYILINETEEKFFGGPPPNSMHKDFDEMLRDLSAGCQERVRVVSDEQDLTTLADERTIIVKVFKKSPTAKNSERELENLLGDYRNTLFYKTCSSLIKKLA
jgi:hypothetical protein